MHCVLLAGFAEFAHFEASLQRLLIFARKIINRLTLSTLELDHVIL